MGWAWQSGTQHIVVGIGSEVSKLLHGGTVHTGTLSRRTDAQGQLSLWHRHTLATVSNAKPKGDEYSTYKKKGLDPTAPGMRHDACGMRHVHVHRPTCPALPSGTMFAATPTMPQITRRGFFGLLVGAVAAGFGTSRAASPPLHPFWRTQTVGGRCALPLTLSDFDAAALIADGRGRDCYDHECDWMRYITTINPQRPTPLSPAPRPPLP